MYNNNNINIFGLSLNITLNIWRRMVCDNL